MKRRNMRPFAGMCGQPCHAFSAVPYQTRPYVQVVLIILWFWRLTALGEPLVLDFLPALCFAGHHTRVVVANRELSVCDWGGGANKLTQAENENTGRGSFFELFYNLFFYRAGFMFVSIARQRSWYCSS